MTGLPRACVLDVETRLSAEARSLLPSGDRATIARSALLEITAASMLEFDVGDRIGEPTLTTVIAGEEGEDHVISRVDEALSRALASGGVLISHNGIAHDVPTCARRALHHWMFGAAGVLGWWRRSGDRHVDTMLAFGDGAGRGPSLLDLAAGLGFSAAVPARSPLSKVPPLREKVEVDVVATAICWFHLGAAERSSERWLADAWRDLARFLLAPGVRAPHLMPLARVGLGLADERDR